MDFYTSPSLLIPGHQLLTSEDEALRKIRETRVMDPTILTDHPPFLWPGIVSSTRVDSYWTRMDLATTLVNFRDDANDGVAFLDSHMSRLPPLGRSIQSDLWIPPSGSQGVPELRVDFYTLRGLTRREMSTDEFIDSLRAGLTKDLSAGMSGGEFRCDVCGLDLFSMDCYHFPGLKYGEKRERATATYVDGHLIEASAVYKGSSPGAFIPAPVKAERGIGTGLVTREVLGQLEDVYRGFGFTAPPKIYQGVPPMPEVEDTKVTSTPEGEERAQGDQTVILNRVHELETLLGSVTQERDSLRAEVDRLRPLAVLGEEYRTTVVDEALKNGVRAQGTGFNETQWKETFRSLPLPVIRELSENWGKLGDKVLVRDQVLTPDPTQPQISGIWAPVQVPASVYA